MAHKYKISSLMRKHGHELIVHGFDQTTDLQAIVAIHSTALGPSLGGARFFPYVNEQESLHDVLRLSKGMSLKSAAAGLDLGGGKAVIVGDPSQIKTANLLKAFGRVVESLGGRYITAEDVGTTVSDMTIVREQTKWVAGLPVSLGGSGDPSPMTALGVVAAMRATAGFLWDDSSLSGRKIAIQGVGKVGAELARLLAEADVELIVADTNPAVVEEVCAETGARFASPANILFERCDILAPCALGAVIREDTISELTCQAIVGSANNQLASEVDAARVAAKGIVYAPDFVVNAGGIVNIAVEFEPGGYNSQRAVTRVEVIGERLSGLLQLSRSQGITPQDAAIGLANERLAGARASKSGSTPGNSVGI